MDGAIAKLRVVRITNDDSGGKNEERGCCRYTVAFCPHYLRMFICRLGDSCRVGPIAMDCSFQESINH